MLETICRHRLSVRTSGSHPGKRGSIPRGDTNDKNLPPVKREIFYYVSQGIEQEGGRGNKCFPVWGDLKGLEGGNPIERICR